MDFWEEYLRAKVLEHFAPGSKILVDVFFEEMSRCGLTLTKKEEAPHESPQHPPV